MKMPWLLLLDSRAFVIVAARSVTVAAAIAAALVALAVAVRLAHHRGWLGLMLIDPDGEITQDVFVDALLPLQFRQRRSRRVDVHKRHMRLTVLAHAVGEGLYPPIFGLLDLSAHLLDDAGELRGQFLDLLRADILARKIDVLV